MVLARDPGSLVEKRLSDIEVWVLGQQNSELITLLATKGRGRKAAVTTSAQTRAISTFSLLDYEVPLPATIELGPVTLAPSVTYVIPLNVVDASKGKLRERNEGYG